MNRTRLHRLSLAALCIAAGCSRVWNDSAYNPRLVERAGTANASQYRVIHYFGAGQDGAFPQAPLTILSGTLYGTTWNGGLGHGTIFAITPTGNERVLYRFGNSPDGFFPRDGLIGINGAIYGTTLHGGVYGFGTFFEVTIAGRERVLYNFGKGSDGRYPIGRLIESKGMLYGATLAGGTSRRGTIFSLTTTGSERVIHNFGKGSDGAFPYDGVCDVSNTLYGTTYFGGNYDGGTVFSIRGTGAQYRVLHSFAVRGSDGYYPQAGVVAMNGALYGTTLNGGAYQTAYNGGGTVFSITPAGAEKVILSFSGQSNGAWPQAPLLAADGVLYGTTASGGAEYGGTIFSVSSTGAESLAHSFGSNATPTSPDGANPEAGLAELNGSFYGTTSVGGKYGKGIVFALTP